MKTIISLAIAGLIGSTAFAQSNKLKKANAYYNHLSYAYAAPLYEKLVGTPAASTEMKSHLAHSYYSLGEMDKAEKMYAEVVQSTQANKNDYFYYAQALKQNGKYVESDQWMKKFEDLSSSDLRAASYSGNVNYVEKIKQMGDRFTIKNLAVNTAATDFGAYPTRDQKTFYFVSSRKKRAFVRNEWSWTSSRFLDLYRAVPESNQELAKPKLLPRKVNSKYHEGPLCYTPDGKMVYFTRNNISKGKKNRKDKEGIQNLKMYRAGLDEDGKWINEEAIPFNSKDYSVGHPSISADGKTLYFVSDMPGGLGGADLYKVSLDADGKFSKPENMGRKFNTEGQEMFPWIDSEGNLFFSSDGLIGLGGLDVFVAPANKTSGFSKVENVGTPVNGQKDDFAFVILKDNKTGYFSSNRDGGKGDDDIYSFTLLRPWKRNIQLEGIVSDLNTHEILPGTPVYLKDSRGIVIDSTYADSKGKYEFEIEPDSEYAVSVTREHYFAKNEQVSTMNSDPDLVVMNQNIELNSSVGLALMCYVTDRKTSQALKGVHITAVDLVSSSPFLDEKTPETGDLRKVIEGKKLSDKLSYQIKLEKEGYLTKVLTFNYVIDRFGEIKVHESLDLAMDPIEVGLDLSKVIEIKPIYFDLGRFAIRPDAAVELDKIVKVMNENPKMVVELGSHTDCRGSKASNQKLSDSRAKASAAYVKSRISNPDRIYGKGFGEAKLINNCACEGAVKSACPEEEHQANRRTEFVIIKM